MISIVERLSGRELHTTYTRDAIGQILSIRDTRGNELTDYTYDLLGHKVCIDHLDGGTKYFVYDARGNLALSRNARGQTVKYTYDKLNRLEKVDVEGQIVEQHFYDVGSGSNLVNRLARVVDESGEIEYSYNQRGLVTEKQRRVKTSNGIKTFTFSYDYNAREQVTQLKYPDGTVVNYEYGPRGLLAKIPGYITDIEYNAAGLTTRTLYSNGIESKNVFEPDNYNLKESSIRQTSTNTFYHHWMYNYDPVGNPLKIDDRLMQVNHVNFQRNFEYDSLYRIIAVVGTLDGTPFQHNYRYDDTGNFIRNEDFENIDLYLEKGGASNRVAGVRDANGEKNLYQYDADGNVIARPGMALSYDARGQLRQVQKDDGTTVEFIYDYQGERICKRLIHNEGIEETLYIDNLIEETDTETIKYINQGNVHHARVNADNITYFFHYDYLGNNIVVTSGGAGNLVLEEGYFPFGSPAYRVGLDISQHRFGMKIFDVEIGLYYFKARYYDPFLGRFMSVDPLMLSTPEKWLTLPAALNPYVYAMNNPVRLVEIEGNSPGIWQVLSGILFITALIAVAFLAPYFLPPLGVGIAKAALVGACLGGAIGLTSAAIQGGDLAKGFWVGVLLGMASSVGGYLVSYAAVGAEISVSGALTGITAGEQLGAHAIQSAFVGFGDGLISGYAGGKGGAKEILFGGLIGAALGFGLGAGMEWAGQNVSSLSWLSGPVVPHVGVGNVMYRGTIAQPIVSYTTSRIMGEELPESVISKFMPYLSSPVAANNQATVNNRLVLSSSDDVIASSVRRQSTQNNSDLKAVFT